MDRFRSLISSLHRQDARAIARAISIVENNEDGADELLSSLDQKRFADTLLLGITGSPGVGKSTLTSALISHYRSLGMRVGIIAIDPSSPISGGALLGDRIRMMGHVLDPDVVVRSMATRGRLGGLCASAGAAVRIMAASGCSPVIIETVGVGQSEMDIVRLADLTLMVMAPGLGDDIQAMKAGLLEVADLMVVNKVDCPGAETLTMDMEAAVRERKDVSELQKKVCRTIASEEKGISELVATISELDRSFRQIGEHEKRRKKTRELEVLDWAVELLKPKLVDEIMRSQDELSSEPRKAAIKLLLKVLAE